MNSLKENIFEIKKKILDYEKQSRRKKNSVTLLAVSKSQDINKIKDAYKYGQKDFGENYIQEAINKINNLKDLNINL